MEESTSHTAEKMQTELERQLFHLKTLYDVSRDLLGTVEVEAVLKNFLLMTTGNFGVIEGFLLLQEIPSQEISEFVCVGFEENLHAKLLESARVFLSKGGQVGIVIDGDALANPGALPQDIVCTLPFKLDDSCSGLLGLGGKIVGDPYSDEDKELLITLVNNLASALKNARYAQALKEAYAEVSSLNRAKDKVINHLSHELLTPIALLKGTLAMLRNKLAPIPEDTWKKTLERAERNLERLGEIQMETHDIIRGEGMRTYGLLSLLLDQCADELETLVAEETGEGPIVERVKNKIEETFGPRECAPEDILLDQFIAEKLEEMRLLFAHREVHLVSSLVPNCVVRMPRDPLEKMVKGLIKNAIENTPDEGKVEVALNQKGDGVQLVVKDTGVGIVEEHQRRIFEGFFPTQETIAYSSKNPFDFNAGGKGADLLRMKIFSERYDFKLAMTSSRCRFIPEASDVCPGRISLCSSCRSAEDCYHSGGTTFEVFFPGDAHTRD